MSSEKKLSQSYNLDITDSSLVNRSGLIGRGIFAQAYNKSPETQYQADMNINLYQQVDETLSQSRGKNNENEAQKTNQKISSRSSFIDSPKETKQNFEDIYGKLMGQISDMKGDFQTNNSTQEPNTAKLLQLGSTETKIVNKFKLKLEGEVSEQPNSELYISGTSRATSRPCEHHNMKNFESIPDSCIGYTSRSSQNGEHFLARKPSFNKISNLQELKNELKTPKQDTEETGSFINLGGGSMMSESSSNLNSISFKQKNVELSQQNVNFSQDDESKPEIDPTITKVEGFENLDCITLDYSDNDPTSRHKKDCTNYLLPTHDSEDQSVNSFQAQSAIKGNNHSQTPNLNKSISKPPQHPSSRKKTYHHEMETTPNIDFSLTSASPKTNTIFSSSNNKIFKTANNKAKMLNLMEEARDSSIYDTITTYNGLTTTNKKEENSLSNYHSINLKEKFTEVVSPDKSNIQRSYTSDCNTFQPSKGEELHLTSQKFSNSTLDEGNLNNSLMLTTNSLLNDSSNLQLAQKSEMKFFYRGVGQSDEKELPQMKLDLSNLSKTETKKGISSDEQRVKKNQNKLNIQLTADFENIQLTKVEEVEDDNLFSTLDPMSSVEQSHRNTNTKSKVQTPQLHSPKNMHKNTHQEILITEMIGDAQNDMCVEEPQLQSTNSSSSSQGLQNLPDVPTPLKSSSSMNDSLKDQNMLQRAIGEFAEEHSTTKKRKSARNLFKKQDKSEVIINKFHFNKDSSNKGTNQDLPIIDLQRELTFDQDYCLEKDISKPQQKELAIEGQTIIRKQSLKILKKETDLKTHVTVEDLKIRHLKSILQRMINNLSKNINERESSLGIKKDKLDRTDLKQEKSPTSLLFQYSVDNSELLKTPDLAKSQISDNSIFKKNEVSTLRLVQNGDPSAFASPIDSNIKTDVKQPQKVPIIPNFNQVMIQGGNNSDDGGVLTFEDRFSKRSNEAFEVFKNTEHNYGNESDSDSSSQSYSLSGRRSMSRKLNIGKVSRRRGRRTIKNESTSQNSMKESKLDQDLKRLDNQNTKQKSKDKPFNYELSNSKSKSKLKSKKFDNQQKFMGYGNSPINYLTPESQLNKFSTKSKVKNSSRSSVFDPLTDTNREAIIRGGLDYDANIHISHSLKKSKSQPKNSKTPKLRRGDIKLRKSNQPEDMEDTDEDYIMKPRFSHRAKSSSPSEECEKPQKISKPYQSKNKKAPLHKDQNQSNFSSEMPILNPMVFNPQPAPAPMYWVQNARAPYMVYPQPMPSNYMDPYFMQIMASYGNVPSGMNMYPMVPVNGQVPPLNMGSAHMQSMNNMNTPHSMSSLNYARNKAKMQKQFNKNHRNNPIYDSEDPHNQKFMKIKEYLDDRESEFIDNGSQLKAFDSEMSRFADHRKAHDREEVNPFEVYSPKQGGIRESEKKRQVLKREKEKIELKNKLKKYDALKSKVEYLKVQASEHEHTKPQHQTQYKEPVKFTIPLSGRKFDKAIKKTSNAAFESLQKCDKENQQNRDNFQKVENQEMTPESFFKDNFESVRPIQSFNPSSRRAKQNYSSSRYGYNYNDNIDQRNAKIQAQIKKKRKEAMKRREAMKKYDKVRVKVQIIFFLLLKLKTNNFR